MATQEGNSSVWNFLLYSYNCLHFSKRNKSKKATSKSVSQKWNIICPSSMSLATKLHILLTVIVEVQMRIGTPANFC